MRMSRRNLIAATVRAVADLVRLLTSFLADMLGSAATCLAGCRNHVRLTTMRSSDSPPWRQVSTLLPVSADIESFAWAVGLHLFRLGFDNGLSHRQLWPLAHYGASWRSSAHNEDVRSRSRWPS
jgi:hypothetical protein